jgi:anti-sigma regulatory factor (Ser/Thr protein kinase)
MLHSALWSYEATFPAEAKSVSRARDFIGRRLTEHDLSYLVDDVRLVASELATNALLHARKPFTLSLEQLVRVVLLTAHGGSPAAQMPVDARVMDTRGRGLFLVDLASHAWGVTEGPGGSTSVWASFVTRPS